MICPKCNHENRDGAKFCNECGSPLAAAVAPAAQQTVVLSQASAEPGDEGAAQAAPEFDFSPVDDGETGVLEAPEGDLAVSEGATGEMAPVAPEDDELVEDWGPYSYDPERDEPDDDTPRAFAQAAGFTAGQTAPIRDTRGIDEMVIGPGYVPPASAWQSGGTMEMPRVEGEAPARRTEVVAPEIGPRKGRGVKIAVVVVLVLAVLGAAAAGATYFLELWGGKTVPDVRGEQVLDATERLEALGFDVRTTEVASDSTPGTVLMSDPQAGTRVEEGSEVVLHVAAPRTIPQIKGLSRADAEAALADAGFRNVTFVTQKSDEPEGSVLAVDPAVGSDATISTAITVTVAEPFRVPAVAGMLEGDAAQAVTEAGFTPNVVYVYSDEAEGTALDTDPVADTALASGSTVTIQVAKSRGTELENVTRSLLAEGTVFTMDGTSYEVVSLTSVSYQGSDTVAYTVSARAFTYLLGIPVYLNASTMSGVITYDANNYVAATDPMISFPVS